MKLSYKLKVAMMDTHGMRKEIVAMAEAGDSEKLKYLLENLKGDEAIMATLKIVNHSTPQALSLLVEAAAYVSPEAARSAIACGRIDMAEVVFPKLLPYQKTNLLFDIILNNREKDVPMAQLLVRHGADLQSALAAVEDIYSDEKAKTEQGQNAVKAMAAKLKPQM